MYYIHLTQLGSSVYKLQLKKNIGSNVYARNLSPFSGYFSCVVLLALANWLVSIEIDVDILKRAYKALIDRCNTIKLSV